MMMPSSEAPAAFRYFYGRILSCRWLFRKDVDDDYGMSLPELRQARISVRPSAMAHTSLIYISLLHCTMSLLRQVPADFADSMSRLSIRYFRFAISMALRSHFAYAA